MFIQRICSVLNEADIPYAVVGGYAVALHGVVRGTVDVDVVISWSLKHLKNTESAFKRMGLVSRVPITAEDVFHFRKEFIEQRQLIAWNFYEPSNPLNQVDIIINYDLKDPSHIQKVSTSVGTVCVLSLEELIKMKKASGRPQDLEDVKALMSVSKYL